MKTPPRALDLIPRKTESGRCGNFQSIDRTGEYEDELRNGSSRLLNALILCQRSDVEHAFRGKDRRNSFQLALIFVRSPKWGFDQSHLIVIIAAIPKSFLSDRLFISEEAFPRQWWHNQRRHSTSSC